MMTPAALYVLILIAPYGQRVYTADPPEVFATRDECVAKARKGNADIARSLRRGERTALEYFCEVRS